MTAETRREIGAYLLEQQLDEVRADCEAMAFPWEEVAVLRQELHAVVEERDQARRFAVAFEQDAAEQERRATTAAAYLADNPGLCTCDQQPCPWCYVQTLLDGTAFHPATTEGAA